MSRERNLMRQLCKAATPHNESLSVQCSDALDALKAQKVTEYDRAVLRLRIDEYKHGERHLRQLGYGKILNDEKFKAMMGGDDSDLIIKGEEEKKSA